MLKPALPDTVSETLDPPGKGLPFLERLMAKFLVSRRARRMARRDVEQLFNDERTQIRTVLGSLSPDQAAKRVLIPRPRGLEDSSRYWSVFMTLDHLRIVNQGTGGLISLLARGETPGRVVSTADVKPSPAVGPDIVDAYETVCTKFEQSVAAIPDLNTPLRWPHPWFGPLNAARWHFTVAFHMGLHRQQIETIAASLR